MSAADPDRDFYHINRAANWSLHPKLSIGDEIDIGGISNPYFSFFEKQRKSVPVTSSTDGSVLDVPGVKFVGAVSTGEINSPNVAKIAHDILVHFVAYIRELIWEDIRKSEFPHLPSRQRCIWLIKDIDGVKYWTKRLGLEGADFQVLKVSAQGRLHIASESYLLGDSEPHEISLQKARKYWLGVVESAGTEEVIFEGRIKVKEVVSSEVYA